MMKKNFSINIVCIICAFLIASPFAFSGVLAVKNITLQLPGTFYYVNSEFVLNANGSADVQTHSAPTSYYDYAIENLSVAISPMVLQEDTSSGGKASGEFFGGGVLTITGDLYEADNGDPIGPAILTNSTILQANMVLSNSETWTLSEISAYASIVQNETLYLTPSGSGLASGIDLGDDTLVIGDMNLKMQFITPNISTFGTSNYASSVAPSVQLSAEIPEPATMMLLTFGSVLISLRKRK